jgi:hypothetical protein
MHMLDTIEQLAAEVHEKVRSGSPRDPLPG